MIQRNTVSLATELKYLTYNRRQSHMGLKLQSLRKKQGIANHRHDRWKQMTARSILNMDDIINILLRNDRPFNTHIQSMGDREISAIVIDEKIAFMFLADRIEDCDALSSAIVYKGKLEHLCGLLFQVTRHQTEESIRKVIGPKLLCGYQAIANQLLRKTNAKSTYQVNRFNSEMHAIDLTRKHGGLTFYKTIAAQLWRARFEGKRDLTCINDHFFFIKDSNHFAIKFLNLTIKSATAQDVRNLLNAGAKPLIGETNVLDYLTAQFKHNKEK